MSETLINQNQISDVDWVKPAGWVDIRSGALPNSIYFLVGHSADYTTYPSFSITPRLTNSGTYDIYIDGIKQVSAVASNTATTITWQTLALTSGFDVTYPTSLRTHIVRITPTGNDTLSDILMGNFTNNGGVLWAHVTAQNNINYQFGSTNAGYGCNHLIGVTCSRDALKVKNLNNAFGNCAELVTLPPLETTGTDTIIHYAFYDCKKLKRIKLIGFNQTSTSVYNSAPFNNCESLEEIIMDNCLTRIANFSGCKSLKKLPTGNTFHNGYQTTIDLKDLKNLSQTVLAIDSSIAKKVLANGTSSNRMDGLKGLTVANDAPFDDASSPQINVSYTGLDRAALVNLFNSLPTVSASQVINVTGATGAADLDATDLAIATGKGWTVTR